MKYLPIIITSIAGFSTLIGYIFIYFKTKNIDKIISVFLSFSVGVIISLCVIELFPEGFKIVYEQINNKYLVLVYSIIFIFIGYFIVYIICKIDNHSTNNLYRVGIVSFLILFVHNALEGIITYITASYDLVLGIKLSIGIILHNIPEGILIAIPIYYSTHDKKKTFNLVLFLALSEIIGAIFAIGFLKDIQSTISIGFMIFIVAGLMSSLIVNEILIEIKNKLYLKEDIISFVIGMSVVVINEILF